MKTNRFYLWAFMFLFFIQIQETKAQDFKLWFKSNQVSFWIRYVPQRGSQYPFYELQIANNSAYNKTIFFNPVLKANGQITSYVSDSGKGVTWSLQPGAIQNFKFYVAGDPYYIKNHVPPYFDFISYKVYDY